MKLLLDQNISYRLKNYIEPLFVEIHHVAAKGMQSASDIEIWNYAKENNFCIVTQDSDFYERSILLGSPPQIIWLRIGNTSTRNIGSIMKSNSENIFDFIKNQDASCLQIWE